MKHSYPPHLPKNSPRLSTQLAWRLLDQYSPGVIPIVARFHLAGAIDGAFTGLDDIAKVAKVAVEVSDMLDQVPLETIKQINGIVPGLAGKLIALKLAVEIINDKK